MSTDSPQYIVGIGASAGGLEALEQLFRNMPTNTGMAFVVVQHLSPNFKSLMDELLARHTSMPIQTVESGVEVEANHIYLIPPRQNMALIDNRLELTPQDTSNDNVNYPIDVFFHSLADERGDTAIGIVLSGTGTDGSRGVKSIYEADGLVIVQSPETADFDGMPNAAIATRSYDLIKASSQMAASLVEFQLDRNKVKNDHEELDEENELSLIFSILKQRFEVDFSHYKMGTILRRIQRRVTFSDSVNLELYVRRLQTDDKEIDLLYRDLLVEVTEFFRDTEAFQILAEDVIPNVVDDAAGDTVRVWVPGCATGEEAYSIAMQLEQYRRQYRPNMKIKVFATDIHQKSLEQASAAIFSAERIANLPANYRENFFEKLSDGRYRINKELRQTVVFAPHNLTQDPPFTKLDLISCRNVLIYLRPETQQKILSYFHFGLNGRGYLFLGPSEHIGDLKDEFDMVNRRWRLYRKRRSIRLPNPPMMSARRARRTVQATLPNRALLPQRQSQVQFWQDALLNRFAPPGLLVNRQYELVHVFGNAGQYLKPMRGRATLEIVKLIIGTLQTPLRAALHRAARDGQSVQYRGIRISAENAADEAAPRFVELTVEPFTAEGDQENYILVTISELVENEPVSAEANQTFAPDEASIEEIATLERELQHTKEHLQATVEELETTNEELQSTNEEMVAANEELQSTNEELHSVNEELYTVNSEYQQKITDLMQVTNDMKNLQRSSRVRTIFLDTDHRIREFTPAAAEIFNLLPQDIGRPIEHLLYTLSLTTTRLREITRVVLSEEIVVTEAVQLPTGEDYLLHVLPYRTEVGIVEGVVLTMTDVSRLKSAERTIAQRARRMATLIEIMSQPSNDVQVQLQFALERATAELGLHMGLISRVNDDICNINVVHAPNGELTPGDLFPLGETYCDISINAIDVIAIHQLEGTDWENHPAYQKFGLNTHIGTKVMVNGECYGALNFSQPHKRRAPFTDEDREFVSLLGVWVGSTLEMRLMQDALTGAQSNLATILSVAQLPILYVNAQTRQIEFVNPAFSKVFGYSSEEAIGESAAILYPSQADFIAWGKRIRELGPEIANKPLEVNFKRKDGTTFLGRVFRAVRFDAEGNIAGFVGTIFDTSLLEVPARSLKDTL